MFDVIIVGARCAGSPTAMLLARKGYRVLCVDKTNCLNDTRASHVIQPAGVSRLQRWGLLHEVIGSGCPPVHQHIVDIGPARLIGSPSPGKGAAVSYCVRRNVLDRVLLEAAVQAGVELREGCAMHELLFEGEAVVGIRGCTPCGREFVENARIVVGADGMHSAVSRLVRAREYNLVEPLTCHFSSYWSGVPVAGTESFLRAGRCFVAIAAENGLTLISVLRPRPEFRQFRSNIEAAWFEVLASAPEFAERVRGGKREGQFTATADTTNFFRFPFGPGWALVGDAGYHRDAITAQGIADAFRDAELLTEALDLGLSERRPLEKALGEYHRRRDERVRAMYELTCRLAALPGPSPQDLALFHALSQNQADTDRFLGTLAGTFSVDEFYSSETVRRILCPTSHRKRLNGVAFPGSQPGLFSRVRRRNSS